MLHGASADNQYILSGCTSVHPYKFGQWFQFRNTFLSGRLIAYHPLYVGIYACAAFIVP